MKRRSGGGAGSTVLPGIIVIIIGVHGFFTWQLLQRVVHLEKQLGIRSAWQVPKVTLPTIRKPELPRLGISSWQVQLDSATAHVERARIAITKGNMGTAREEAASAIETLTRISRMPAVDHDAISTLRRQLMGIESQIKRVDGTSQISKGTTK